tara:strand:- start:48 stop:254 length:207 start_codon:yes stop_codon:yes gene_type:complete
MEKTWNLIKKESAELGDNIKDQAYQSFYGPVGILSKPIRFFFYAGALGVAQLLIFQVINGAINKAMDE